MTIPATDMFKATGHAYSAAAAAPRDGAASAVEHSEGRLARQIEEQTAKLPSDTFLWAAVASIVASASLQAMGQKHGSLFVGQWAPVFLMFGIYNKLVKQLGSDQLDRPTA
jgi:hypothetical protein